MSFLASFFTAFHCITWYMFVSCTRKGKMNTGVAVCYTVLIALYVIVASILVVIENH